MDPNTGETGMFDNWWPFIVGALATAVGYGELRSKVTNAHKRLDDHASEHKENIREMRGSVEAIRADIADFREYVAAHLPRKQDPK